MSFCQYKDIFGKPNDGFHQMRIFGFALLDIVGTIIAAGVISFFSGFSFLLTLIVLFVLAVLLHWMFCVDTRFMQIIKGK